MRDIGPKKPRIKLAPDGYEILRHRVLERDNWRCQNCDRCRTSKFTTRPCEANKGATRKRTSSLCALPVMLANTAEKQKRNDWTRKTVDAASVEQWGGHTVT
jgi:hypothetical protein